MLRDACCSVWEQRIISSAQVMMINILSPEFELVSKLVNCVWISGSWAVVKTTKLRFHTSPRKCRLSNDRIMPAIAVKSSAAA